MIEQLTAAVDRHASFTGLTAVPRLLVVGLDEPIAPAGQLYTPMICFIVRGAKRSISGEQSWVAGEGDMFLNALDRPVTVAFERVPYRSVVLRIDGRVLTDLLLELGPGAEAAEPAGPAIAAMPPELIDALLRLVGLLDSPADIRALAGRIESEILYRLLSGPLGPALRQWARADTAGARIRETASWICDHYAAPFSIEEVAAVAHMSPATLHRHFKAATGMSPLQFQKQVRMQEARRLLLAGDSTAARVAADVGYVSATQFNREYKRFHGLPPGQDVARFLTQI